MAVGVALAFMWNAAESHTQGDTGVTSKIQLTVEQAAEQAWASARPATAAGGSPQTIGGGQRPAAHPRESGRPAVCWRVNKLRAPGPAIGVRVISGCGPRPRFPGEFETDSAVSGPVRPNPAR